MWSLARCAAELEGQMPKNNVTLAISFKLPVFLPSTVSMNYDVQANGIQYELKNASGDKTHLSGQVIYQAD